MKEITPKQESILGLVVYAPVLHIVIFIFGFFAHLLFPVPLFRGGSLIVPGAILLLISPLIILWSQRELRKFRTSLDGAPVNFARGPYKITRNPTYLGLFLLTLGFSFIANSLVLVIASVAAFLAVRIFIVPKEEALMEKKYGEAYLRYRESVGRWF